MAPSIAASPALPRSSPKQPSGGAYGPGAAAPGSAGGGGGGGGGGGSRANVGVRFNLGGASGTATPTTGSPQGGRAGPTTPVAVPSPPSLRAVPPAVPPPAAATVVVAPYCAPAVGVADVVPGAGAGAGAPGCGVTLWHGPVEEAAAHGLPSALATCLPPGELVIVVRVPSEADARVGTAGVVHVLCHAAAANADLSDVVRAVESRVGSAPLAHSLPPADPSVIRSPWLEALTSTAAPLKCPWMHVSTSPQPHALVAGAVSVVPGAPESVLALKAALSLPATDVAMSVVVAVTLDGDTIGGAGVGLVRVHGTHLLRRWCYQLLCGSGSGDASMPVSSWSPAPVLSCVLPCASALALLADATLFSVVSKTAPSSSSPLTLPPSRSSAAWVLQPLAPLFPASACGPSRSVMHLCRPRAVGCQAASSARCGAVVGAREVDVPSLADLANAMVGRRVGLDVPGGRPAEAGEETSHVVLWVDAEENAASLGCRRGAETLLVRYLRAVMGQALFPAEGLVMVVVVHGHDGSLGSGAPPSLTAGQHLPPRGLAPIWTPGSSSPSDTYTPAQLADALAGLEGLEVASVTGNRCVCRVLHPGVRAVALPVGPQPQRPTNFAVVGCVRAVPLGY